VDGKLKFAIILIALQRVSTEAEILLIEENQIAIKLS